jgi:hypothetical protein
MDVVMTPEERAAMEAAEGEGVDPSASGEAVPGEASATNVPAGTGVGSEASINGTTTASSAPFTAPAPSHLDGTLAHQAEASNTSLAHHSSFSTPPPGSASASTDQLSKKPGETQTGKDKDKKGKHKLSPEQKAQLDALEKKRDEEKQKR